MPRKLHFQSILERNRSFHFSKSAQIVSETLSHAEATSEHIVYSPTISETAHMPNLFSEDVAVLSDMLKELIIFLDNLKKYATPFPNYHTSCYLSKSEKLETYI